MKKLTIILLLFCSITAFSQQLKAYTASNGITYEIKDTIQLGIGSGQDRDFLCFQNGWAMAIGEDGNIDQSFSGANVIVRKIKTAVTGKVYFIVKVKGVGGLILYIEDAIKYKEVVY